MDHDITPRLELSHSAEPTTTRPQPRSSSPGPSDPRLATACSLSGSPGSIQAFPVFPLPPSGPSTGLPAPATHVDDYERPSSDSRSSPPLPPLPGATTGSMPLLTSDQGVWGSNTMNQRSIGPNPNPYGVPRMSTMEMLGQSKPMSMDRGVSMTRRSTIDWVVPTVEDKVRPSPRAFECFLYAPSSCIGCITSTENSRRAARTDSSFGHHREGQICAKGEANGLGA